MTGPEHAAGPQRGRDLTVITGCVAAAIVLVPFATTTLPLRSALVAQAVAITALVVVLLLVGVGRPGWWKRLRATPPTLALPVVVYGAAAAAGAVVGLVRGNQPAAVAGQLLSMGLLPLGAAAGFLLPERGRVRGVAAGVVTGAMVATVIHVGSVITGAFAGRVTVRLYLANNVSVSGVSLLALLVVCGFLRTSRHSRVPLGVAAVLLVTAVLASGTRSLWIVSGVGLGVFAVLERPWRRAGALAWVRAAAVLAGAVAIASAAAFAWWEYPRPAIEPDVAALWSGGPSTDVESLAATAGRPAVVWRGDGRRVGAWLVEGLPVRPGSYRFEVDAGHLGGRAETVVWLYAMNDAGTPCWRRAFRVSGSGEATTGGAASFPAGTETVAIGVRDAGGELRRATDPAFYVAGLSLVRVSASPVPALLAREVEFLVGRGRSFGRIGDEASVAGRLTELHDVVRAYARGGWPVWLLGAGLGATYPVTPTAAGEAAGTGHYIHNFYAFLLYKLGAVGLIAVGASLALVAVALLRRSGRFGTGGTSALASGFAAAWIAYLAWSVACPEILDFRFAPLWGLVIAAAAANGRGRSGADREDG